MTKADKCNQPFPGSPVACRAVLGGVATGLLSSLAPASATARRVSLDPGRGTFCSTRAKGVSVRYWLPENFAKDDPILFVLPGVDRDAQSYRDSWVPYARRENALLLVPQFSSEDYPGSRSYNLGNMFDAKGTSNPPKDWSFTKIEELFDEVRDEIGSMQTGYLLYGHSAGAQFVHRLVLFMPKTRIERAVSANAGWYTFPDFATPFPYGLAGTLLTGADVAAAFARNYTILLGTSDTDAAHPTLRTTPEADKQGANRYVRGMAFFGAARAKAAELGVHFGWRVSTVPGATHSNAEVAIAAANALFGGH